MKRGILFRFFEQETTVTEEKQLRQWLETSEEHQRIFDRERMLYDALLITTPNRLPKQRQHLPIYVWTSVAAVTLLFILGGWYLFVSKEKTESYNTLLVPAGQRVNLILSDNSNVWLNANTTFKYPSRFLGRSRMVYLDGEGYFEVREDARRPFVVKTGLGDVRVTGTQFNVEAYSKYGTFETGLFSGGVEIYQNDKKIVSLKSQEKSSWKNDRLVVSKITDTDEYLWREGLIAFNNKRLEEIFSSLEKYFGVNIQVKGKNLSQHTYTGKFRQSDGVDYALRVLQRNIRFTYERNEETGTIYIK